MLSLVHLSLTRSRDGVRPFRWLAARDVGCILDVNPSVTAWRCMPSPFGVDGITYVPDFQVFDEDVPPFVWTRPIGLFQWMDRPPHF